MFEPANRPLLWRKMGMRYGQQEKSGCETAREFAITALREIAGEENVLTDAGDMEKYLRDWTGTYSGSAIAVVRPASTDEVADIVKLCTKLQVAITPQGGNTGVAGGCIPTGSGAGIVLALDRMQRIRQIDTLERIARVDAGVVLENLQIEVGEHDLIFPLVFGAKGSCSLGGNLATNAGGSNVLRYGNARELCLGIEAVLPDGTVVDTLSALRKDNTGYDLRDLLIGSEGTLGIITGAALKLFPKPRATVTAFLGLANVGTALAILNVLQDATGGLVEAFEYMPAPIVKLVCERVSGARYPLGDVCATNILVEVASSRRSDAMTLEDGSVRLESELMEILGELMEEGLIEDAAIATSDQQRQEFWTLRESVLESLTSQGKFYTFDIALPLPQVPSFIETITPEAERLGFQPLVVGHLGDGNLHFAVAASKDNEWADLPLAELQELVLAKVRKLNGTFSAEHGIGQSKTKLMKTQKQASQLAAMRALKDALDPHGIMNPGKLLPANEAPV